MVGRSSLLRPTGSIRRMRISSCPAASPHRAMRFGPAICVHSAPDVDAAGHHIRHYSIPTSMMWSDLQLSILGPATQLCRGLSVSALSALRRVDAAQPDAHWLRSASAAGGQGVTIGPADRRAVPRHAAGEGAMRLAPAALCGGRWASVKRKLEAATAAAMACITSKCQKGEPGATLAASQLFARQALQVFGAAYPMKRSKRLRHIPQRNRSSGCGVACVAMAAGVSYSRALREASSADFGLFMGA